VDRSPATGENARTVASYDRSAALYRSLSAAQPPEGLLPLLRELVRQASGGSVLELGSGPGTDARWLATHGLTVQRTDASSAFVELLQADGHEARLLNVVTDELGGPYDAIYACAVLLHLTIEELRLALRKARAAARALAFTVKEGDGSEWTCAKLRMPRWFQYWRAESLAAELAAAGWHAQTLRQVPGRDCEWLQVLAT
jgi:SAM-dependent methyltransferase